MSVLILLWWGEGLFLCSLLITPVPFYVSKPRGTRWGEGESPSCPVSLFHRLPGEWAGCFSLGTSVQMQDLLYGHCVVLWRALQRLRYPAPGVRGPAEV